MALPAKRHWNKLAILARIETDYGTSAAPSGPADGMQMTEASLTPLAGEEASRDLMLPYFGHQGALLVGDHVELEGAVELAGSGIAGTAPACSPLLRACALSETVVATTSVTYTPVSTAPESATIFANLDGVNHALLGARGTSAPPSSASSKAFPPSASSTITIAFRARKKAFSIFTASTAACAAGASVAFRPAGACWPRAG